MPTWSEYKEIAKSRGALAYELFVVVSTPVAAPEALAETLPDHLAYLKQKEGTGELAFAGPLSDESGEQMNGEGMLFYRAESLEAARALAAADPMHSTGKRTFTLRRWLMNEGSLNLGLTLSSQSVGLG